VHLSCSNRVGSAVERADMGTLLDSFANRNLAATIANIDQGEECHRNLTNDSTIL
jgi:hypothetical protein